jgi:hypothetical protein
MHKRAPYIHRVANGKHAHLQIGEVERNHLNIEDSLVKGLRPIDIGSWDLEPADSVCEYHNVNIWY